MGGKLIPLHIVARAHARPYVCVQNPTCIYTSSAAGKSAVCVYDSVSVYEVGTSYLYPVLHVCQSSISSRVAPALGTPVALSLTFRACPSAHVPNRAVNVQAYTHATRAGAKTL